MDKTGLAHMFEHMAFKGTETIGTTDYAAEKPALQKVETAYAAYLTERDKTVGRDEEKLKQLEKAWKDAIAEADKYVVPNQFGKIIEQSGGEDMNAFTDYDETAYHYSLPVNRVELWAYLESERFLHPVLREFYKERNVVIEERRMRTDSNPTGRLEEQFNAAAFEAHPYHRPTVGWMSDLNSFSATDAKQFFDRYYVAANMVVAVAGDVKAAQAIPILEKYFGRLPPSSKPDETTTTEPPQNSERSVVLKESAQPLYLEGYHRPDYMSRMTRCMTRLPILCRRGVPRGCTAPWCATRKLRRSPPDLPDCRAPSIPTCLLSTRSRCPATRRRGCGRDSRGD